MTPLARKIWQRRVTASVAVVGVLAGPLVLIGHAVSDPIQPPGFTTVASVVAPPQTNVPNPGPLTGLVNGTTVTITMAAAAGSASAGKFFGAEVRLCKGGVNITFQSQFNPTQGGNCIPMPFNAQSTDDVIVNSDPTNSMATATFNVGVGSQTFQANSVSTVTCDAADPCALWIKESFNSALLQAGFQFVHFDLQYALSGTTTTAASTTTTVPSTTTTVGSTTTTVPSTTTTVGSTTTTVPSTTTTVGSTTTTVPSTTTTVPSTTTTVASTTTTVASTTTTVPSTTTTVPSTTTTTVPSTTTTTVPSTTTTTVPSTTTTTVPSNNTFVCSILGTIARFLPFLRPVLARLLVLLGCRVG